MAYSIRLPDGTLVRNIPDELSPEQAKERIIKAYPQYAPESGVLRQAADIPVQVGRGAVMGVRMLSDALGADNPVSQALRGAEDYLGDLLSAQAKQDQKEIARILKDAEDKGVLDQVKAGIQALTVAPVDLVSQVLGTAVPTIAAGMAGAAAKLGAVGIGTLQAGTGAAMGAGLTKGNIYEVVKEELMAAKVPEEIAEERAKAAQNYTGENWDQIILGGTLGGAAALGPLERIFARLPAISPQVAAKNLFTRAGVAGVAEAAPEAAQAFQEQVAQNLALQREGFDVPTFRGAVANATLEGLAGFGIGAPIGALEGKPGATKPPGQQDPTEPAAPPPAAPIVPEGELTPEEEAELQARIAAAPPPPPAAVLAEPTPPIPPTPAPAAVQPVTATPEAVALPETQQVTPQAAPELEALTAQLGQIQQARMDPTLSPDDPAFLEFDQQEAAIQSRIQQLTAPPVAVTQPPAQPLAPEITSPAAPVITPIIAQTPPSPLQAPKGAADNFLDAVVTQFGMDRGEAQKALDTLVQEELIELDPNSGQFRMKDGRFWDPDVMRKAAAMQTAAPPLQLPQPLAPPVAPVVEPEVIPEEAMVTPEIQVPFDETLTPPGPTLEDQVRAQKAEERRERQAAQEAKKGEFVLQNRDRSSTGSIQQMQNIANAPDYSRAGFSRTPDGAPIIAFGDYAPEQLGREDVVTTARGRKIPIQYAVVEADEVITSNDIQGRADNRYGDKSVPGPRAIAGNGRVTGLREAFERGTATPYVEEMAADSALHGISPDVIAGMQKPVLVRVMPQEGLTRDIGDELNLSSMLELSPVEQAKNDLNRVDFEGLQFNEEGEITNESLSQFIAAQPVEERTKLIDRGLPTKQARQRLENAIFARAYADDDLIAMFAQTEDVEARLVINALAQVAPQMAQLEGAGDLDIRDIVTDAAKIIVSGKRRGLKLKEISAQVDMTVDPDTKIIVDMFAQNPRSNKAAIESLRNAAELAYNESIRPEEGLFGVEPRRERRDIMEQMRRGYEPTRTEDVAAAERPRPAPSDVERKAEPIAATVPPADQGFQLTGQTPEELAELQRKELSGEAEAERDRLEAEEAAKAAEIAAKKVAEQKGEQPGDLAPTTGKMELSAPPITDLFGTQGITDQPVRGPRRVAAEPSPIEKLAAKEPTVDEAIEEELKKAGYDDLGKMSKNIQDEFGVGKPVADAYARAVQNARIQVVRSQFGLVTESQLREALNEQTKLRNRIDGIVKRKEPKKEPEAEKKPSIRKTREVAEGTVVERIELPDNIEIRIVKLKDGYSVYQYDLDADQIVMGQQRQFRSPAFKNDQDAYQAAEAFASDMFDKVVPKMADEMQAAMKERLSRGEDVINNKTPDPDIPADQRLVLMACCATKKKGMGMGPAIEVYTGVFFQTLKNKLKEGAMPNLRILSAKYGFIAPDQKIEVYDQVMDKSSADGFMLDDKLVEGFPSNIKDVLIVGSDQYQRVMKAAVEDLIKAGKIDKGASINVTKGGIGEQRSQLGKYLQAIPVKKEPEAKKEEKPKAEQFVRGTEEQLKEIKEFAKRYGGSEVAYYDPDKDIGMVLAFGKFDGDPKYIPYIKGVFGRTAFDISVAKFSDVLPYKAELLEIKERLEKAAEKKHQENPFIKFERGIALSDGMDPKIEGIIREWKDMLGLGGINIYFSTTEDAKKNINNFTGPHRRIGSATIDANERGSMRRMEGGASYYVVFDKSTSTTKMLEVIAHEIGHVHEKVAFDQAPQEVKDKLKAAYEKWLEQRKDKTSREAMQMLRAKTTAKTTDIGQTIETAEQLDKLDPYWSKFSEWYADQVSRWAVTDEKPVGVVEKFFARLGAALRRFYQTLKGQKYLPDETFVQYLSQVKPTIVETIPGPIKDQVNQDMSSKMLKDLFGSEKEAVDIKRIMEVYPPKKKLPPKRSPELAAAAAALNAGELTAAEYDALVNIYRPIPYYFEPLKPATEEQVIGALDVSKKPKANPVIQNGHKVGLRLDIPAFDRHGVFVVSIHQKRKPSSTGEIIGYASVAKAKNVTFGIGNELKALDIAMGKGKDALQTMEGEYVNITPEQAFAEAQRAIKDPSYVQVGFDPARHSYFFDRRTTLPVVSAEEVLQIGNMILAKKPVFGRKQDFLYNIDSAPVQSAAELDAKRDRENQEKLQDLKDQRPTKIALPEKVRSYASSEEGQRVIAALNMTGEELERTVQKQYEGYTADNFMRRARKGLDEGEISADVFAVVQSMYMADPKLLDGLRLDVKQKFTPEELAQRRAEGKPSPMGAFAPFERVVYLYTGTKGVTDPMTIRHELTHTLEQMMTPAQRKAVINAYIAALKKSAKKHKDAKSREFFDNVVKYLNEPSNDTRDAMNKSLPSLDFYQFTSPSEYWAVNAEKLMAQRLGTAWDRFKKAVRKMFEKMKNILGFDNGFVVHDVFDKIMSGSKERMDTEMLANFVASSKQEYEMIEKTKEDAELVRRYNRADTPMLDHSPMRRMIANAGSFTKDMFKDMAQNPSESLRMMFNSLNRGVMYLRNKFIWFGSGINEADRIRYNGAVKTAEGLATASLALDNMIRGGNIATQTVFQGGIEFNKDTQMYSAVKKDKSMTKVYEAEAKLKERLGEQLGTNIIQGYLEAKRSRSIKEEVETRKEIVEAINEEVEAQVAALKALDADPKATKEQKDAVNRELRKLFKEYRQAREELSTITKIAEEKVTMSEAEIEDFISREEAHPELKEILDNFGAVNQNLLRFWKDVGLLSDPRYERLAAIKDYVPWYRIMNDEEDVHSPLQATTRSATNIGKEKLFKSGKPSVINDFIIEEGQDVFKIQPSRINAVKLNGIRLKPDQYESTPNGEVRLKVEYKPNDVLVIETQREIENMIDNMTRNVMRMTMNGLRQYAANRIGSEYATRDSKGQIMTFPKVDREKGRFDYIYNGRRTIVEIQDPLIAEAVLGMETVGMEMWKPLAAAANFTRRTITLSPVFQLKQVFKDAPTAALVTGVKRPDLLMGGVMRDFIGAVRDNDPVAEILRSQGIGGFYSPARTPEADVKRRIGIINNNTFDYTMKALDHFGDSSDMAQRIAIYKRVMAETGNESLALYQAANVINFLRHGSGQVAQALVKTVPFLNAYAQSIDVLYDALRGGGLRGKDRSAALIQLGYTGSLLAGSTLLYAFLVGDDDDYMKMDDQSKIRSYMIPGTDVVLPMNTSAAFFFKAIPELLYNKVVNEGTENEVDAKRLRTAMKEAAVDLLLGPTPVPSAVKPVIEIGLDYNFFTSRPITPRGMDNLDAYQQYDMRTSEAAKLLSALTGSKENRVLNPMEADHLVRSIFGTAGAMVAWSSNLVGQAAEFRPEMGLKEMPITGAFMRPEVPRGREDLFYRLKDDTDRKYRTYDRLVRRGDEAEAQAYLNRHQNLLAYYEYTSEMDAQLKEINDAIRFIGETQDPSYTPEIKRREIQEFLNLKQDVLEGIEQFRKEAYAD
jgi:hypothetical protein